MAACECFHARIDGQQAMSARQVTGAAKAKYHANSRNP